jgi:sigma-B regulation protein RsbU (phosphoserine phosphatase)
VSLDSQTFPLGLFPTLPDVQESIQVAPGDWLLVFSDGITEALNEKGEEFGRERLVEITARKSLGTAGEIRNAILAEVRRDSRGWPQSDDLTLIVGHVL